MKPTTMLLKQLALAATTAAFLLIPDASTVQYGRIFTTIPSTAMAQSVSLPCSQCKGKGTQLEMDFNVESTNRLTLNGFELYPQVDPWNGDLTASVVRSNGKAKEQRLGYSLAVEPLAVDQDQRLEIVDVRLRIIEVGGRFIDGLPTVEVKLIKAETGELLIGNIKVEDAPGPSSGPSIDTSFLRIKEKFRKLWKQIKGGCSRLDATATASPSNNHKTDKTASENRPAHHHNHHRHSWGKLIKNIAANVILPVLTGITAGVGVAVLGMALCSFFAIVFRARRKRRSQRRSSRRSEATVRDAAHEEEKTGLMDAQDPPPGYEEEEETI